MMVTGGKGAGEFSVRENGAANVFFQGMAREGWATKDEPLPSE